MCILQTINKNYSCQKLIMILFIQSNINNKWSKKEKLYQLGVTLFCSILIINTFITNNISFDKLNKKTIFIKKIEKSYGKVKTQFNWVLISEKNNKYFISADFNKCIDHSLFNNNLKGEKITISTYNDFLRNTFSKSKLICYLNYDGKTYLDTTCMKKESKMNFSISIIFGLFAILIFTSATYIDRTRNNA